MPNPSTLAEQEQDEELLDAATLIECRVDAVSGVLHATIFMPLAYARQRIAAGTPRKNGVSLELTLDVPELVGHDLVDGQRCWLGNAGEARRSGVARDR